MIPQHDHSDSAPAALPRLSARSRTHLISWALVAGLAVLGLLFLFSDARKLWQTASELDATLLLIPFACAAASYLAMARSYQGIARAAGSDIPFWEMVKITFVANTVNYV